MKLCFVCPEYPPGPHGGVGTMTQMLGRALAAEGHEVRVVGVYRNGYPAPDYEEDEGVRVWRLREPSTRFGWVLGRYQLYKQVKRWADRGEIDLVDSPDSRGWFAGWPRLPVPLILRVNGSLSYFAHELHREPKLNTYRLEKWSHQRADHWVAVSEHTAKLTKEIFSLNHAAEAILYNPVSLPADAPSIADRDSNLVVFSGTLTPKKGIISLIKAWPSVRGQVPSARLHVYGKDTNAQEGDVTMRQLLVSKLPEKHRDSVTFFGHVDREVLLDAESKARVAVFPSYTETFGIAPVESMAQGCPTIYTTLTCGPEIIRHNRDGLLIDPNSPSTIADAITDVLTNDRLAEELSRAGRKRVADQFDIRPLTRKNIAYYESVLAAAQQ